MVAERDDVILSTQRTPQWGQRCPTLARGTEVAGGFGPGTGRVRLCRVPGLWRFVFIHSYCISKTLTSVLLDCSDRVSGRRPLGGKRGRALCVYRTVMPPPTASPRRCGPRPASGRPAPCAGASRCSARTSASTRPPTPGRCRSSAGRRPRTSPSATASR